jgi:hypothetical protein
MFTLGRRLPAHAILAQAVADMGTCCQWQWTAAVSSYEKLDTAASGADRPRAASEVRSALP